MKAKSLSSFSVKGDLGYISLDEALDLYNFESLITYDKYFEKNKNSNSMIDKINDIAKKYLNEKELCIYYLSVAESKKTTEIVEIFNYNNWRTAQNSINRVYKLLGLYYSLEQINKEDLNFEISRNFTVLERNVIKYLEDRLTIEQINEKIKKKKYHYAKTHSLIKNILDRLENSGSTCKQYHEFLINIRKFKNLCVFQESENIIKGELKNGKIK